MSDRVFTIPVGTPFLAQLAQGVWQRVDGDPIRLSDVQLLLPTRRATRSAADAFLAFGEGRPMLLPALRTVSDVEEDVLELEVPEPDFADALPPAIPELRRRLELARLVLRFIERGDPHGPGTPRTPEHALRLAAALTRLIDEVQLQGLSFDALAQLVPDSYAEHWSITLDFLEIVTRFWPERLAELQAVDPMARRDALMRAQAAAWRARPPETPVLIAGSTGSVPATADLMRVVLRLPHGAIVLPGLDQESDDACWAAIGTDPSHPQFGLHRLLEALEIDRRAVRVWAGAPANRRAALIREVMRPAATSERWQDLKTAADPVSPLLFDGIRRIDAASPREEAGIIALLMREVLETPGRTAALVTPDRFLARRVAVELRRWGVKGSDGRRLAVDDSAGTPLNEAPTAVFLRLLAAALPDAAPVALLSLLKHPLAAAGRKRKAFTGFVHALEREVLRGPCPEPGLSELRQAVLRSVEESDRLSRLLAGLDPLIDMLAPLEKALRSDGLPVAELLQTHIHTAEALAATEDRPGTDRLWVGEAGEALAAVIAELSAADRGFAPIAGAHWPGFLDAVLENRVVRPRFGSHPRLHILGTLEARLLSFDRVILGGLNEGVWPADPAPDPWMSRPMRRSFGLPPLELGIGKTAHDVAGLLGADDVILTRAQRVDGAPTIPSRWLRRLATVARAVDAEDRLESWTAPGDWHAALDRPDRPDRASPPAPRPPLAARPRQLSVTRIETWLRDPYSVYARHILNLRPLDALDADPTAAERGLAIHQALDRFVRAHPRDLPEDALAVLIAMGEEAFAPHLERPGVRAFWLPRFAKVAGWFIEQERARRPGLQLSATECRGQAVMQGPAGPFTLTGIADRVDRLADDSYALLDYKTGNWPKLSDLKAGRAPQLSLEALILERGGFAELAAAPVSSLAYWRVGGGDPPGRIDGLETGIAGLIEQAERGLRNLIATFDDPETPYHAVPDPRRAPRFNDYDHLARTGEWMTVDDGG